MRYLFGDCALDTHRCELRRTGTLIKLRPKVFDVLTYLIAHRDRVITRQELLEHLWPQQFVGEATLNSCIMEARQAVGDTGQVQRLIQTLHGRGYRFVGAVEEASDSLPAEATHAPLAFSRASMPENLGQAVVHRLVLGREAPTGAKGSSASPDGLEGERKQVTILCCALADARGVAAHVGSEAMYRLMQGFFALAQRVVQRYAGTLTQRLNDGFVALFGAPVAQEDHARRAVLAALELQQRAREAPALREPLRGASLATSMGLHTGMIIVGPLGEDVHTLYAALDDTTDLADRLQRLAGPDTILMSETTRRLVQEEVRVESYDALDMVALPGPPPVYKVCAVMARRSGVPGRGGRIADAVPLLTQALEQAMASTRAWHQVLCSLPLSEVQMLAGRLEEAHALAEHALTLAREHQERGNQAYALCLLGEIVMRRDHSQAEPAETHHRQALALADELGMRPLQAHCHLGLGTLYAKIDQRERARAELSAAIELYRAMEMTFWLPQVEAALMQMQAP
jgi:DNA-binding winged helix-turn-helix (wHTH) protein/class 3 adenylate cyclase